MKSGGKSSLTRSTLFFFLKFIGVTAGITLAQYSHLLKDTILVAKIVKIDEEHVWEDGL